MNRFSAFSMPWKEAIVVRGDVRIRLLRPGIVDVVEEVGDPTCDARDSTAEIGRDCQPLFTFTMAYDRRALNSADSYFNHQLAVNTKKRRGWGKRKNARIRGELSRG